MKATIDLFSTLSSTDKMIADETFDHILFSTSPKMNYNIIDMMKYFKDDQKILPQCIQLLSLRCSQNKTEKFSCRPQTEKEQTSIVEAIVDCLNSTQTTVRLEALIGLDDIFNYTENGSQLIEALRSNNLPFVFANQELQDLVLERVETCAHDPNSSIAKRADVYFEHINSNILTAQKYLNRNTTTNEKKHRH